MSTLRIAHSCAYIADDIVFTATDGPSPFAHPFCANTWRNGQKLGDEAPAAGY